MFVISINYISDLSVVDSYIEEHIAFLDKYYEAGYFIASGRKEPRTGGIILAQASTRAELQEIVAQDPFFKAGIAEYELTEFTPSKVANGFEVLNQPS